LENAPGHVIQIRFDRQFGSGGAIEPVDQPNAVKLTEVFQPGGAFRKDLDAAFDVFRPARLYRRASLLFAWRMDHADRFEIDESGFQDGRVILLDS
jgi:hypothetical protein